MLVLVLFSDFVGAGETCIDELDSVTLQRIADVLADHWNEYILATNESHWFEGVFPNDFVATDSDDAGQSAPDE